MTTSTAVRPRSTARWIEARFPSYARWCVLIVVFVTPLLFAQGGITIFHLPKLALIWYFAWIALVFTWIRSTVASSVRPVKSWLLRASALYLLVAALATANSPYLPVSVIGMYGRYQGFVTHIVMVALLLAIVRTFAGHPERLDALAVAAVAAGGIVASYVVIQEAGLDWMQWGELGFSPRHIGRATLGNSNFAGGFLGMVSPLCLYLALTRDRPAARELYAATLAVILLGVWFADSRGGMLAAAVGFATLALAYRSHLRKGISAAGTKRVVYALLAILLAAAAVYFNPLQNRSSGPRDLFRSSTLEGRVERWTAGLDAIGQNPWLGSGPDTFYATFTPNRGEEKELEELTNNAHNIFIEHANGKGLLGLGAYLLLVGSASFFAVRRSRQIAGRERFRLVAFGSVLAAYLAQGFFSLDVIGIAVMGWTVLGTLAVLADPLVLTSRPPESKDAEIVVRSPRRRAFAIAAIVTVLAPVLVLPVLPLGADYAARAAQRSTTLSEFNQLFNHARQLNPYEADYAYRQGRGLARLAEEASDPATADRLYRQATDNLKEALSLRPQDIRILMELAMVYSRWGEVSSDLDRFRQSDRLWEEALALDPRGYRVRNGLARNLDSWIAAGNDSTLRLRQILTLEESLRIQPRQPKAAARLAGAYSAAGRERDADSLLAAHFGRPITEPERSAVAESELDDKRLRSIIEQWQDRPAEVELPELIAQIENEPRTVSQNRLGRLITIGVLGLVVIAAVAITQRLGSQRNDDAPENEPGLLYVSERKLLQQLTPYRGLRWLAIPGLWSLALSLPYLPLLLEPANSLHRAEVAAHAVPGLILVTAAGFYDSRAHLGRSGSAAHSPVWRWASLGLGIVMVVLHFPPISPPPSGSPAWSKLLMHLAPAVMTILIARPEIFAWLRGHSTAPIQSA